MAKTPSKSTAAPLTAADFEASLKVGSRPYLRATITDQTKDSKGGVASWFAAPGTQVSITDVDVTRAGRLFYCKFTAQCTTAEGGEKPSTLRRWLKADALCAKREEALGG